MFDLESPSFLKEPTGFNGQEGKEVRLEFTAKGQPIPKVWWKQSGG